jgi:hypothetical protein
VNSKTGSIRERLANYRSRRKPAPPARAAPGRVQPGEGLHVNIGQLRSEKELLQSLAQGYSVVLYCAGTRPFGGSNFLMREIEKARKEIFHVMPPYLASIHAFPSAAQAGEFGRSHEIEISLRPDVPQSQGRPVRWLDRRKLMEAEAEAASVLFYAHELRRLVHEYLGSSGSHDGKSVILIDPRLVNVRARSK